VKDRNSKEISMNVTHIKDANAQLIRKYQRNESVTSVAGEQAGSAAMKTQEKINCSNTLTEIWEAKAEVSEVPDVRNDKVLEIKDQIERGIYNVSGEQIACKMMKESSIHLGSIFS
jgi:negative regulator of flagellin synthesis FlgM